MTTPVFDLSELLGSLQPVWNEGVYVFASVAFDADWTRLEPVAAMREPEGWTVVVEEARAAAAGLEGLFRAAWITLSVTSDLEAVGLTATFAGALAAAGVSCNVVAGAFHDHLFVPVDAAPAAMATLMGLRGAAAGDAKGREARTDGADGAAPSLS